MKHCYKKPGHVLKIAILLASISPSLCSIACRNDKPATGWKGRQDAKRGKSSTPSSRPPTPVLSFIPSDDSDEPVDVLSINGQSIDVDDVLQPIRPFLQDRAHALPPGEYTALLGDTIRQRVQLLARDALVYNEAQKGFTDENETAIDQFIDQQVRDRINRDFAGRQTRFERALADEGSSLDDERQRLRREIIIAQWLRNTITPKIADPTRDELWSIFESRKDAQSKPERRKLRLIEVSVTAQLPDNVTAPTPDQLSDARSAAWIITQTAREQIRAGADFADVARKYSTGISARNGGEWGWVTRGSVREHLEPAVDALFSLPAAQQPSDVVETPQAFFVVQADEIEVAEDLVFESIQPALIERYREVRFEALVEELIAELQSTARIRPTNINRFLQSVVAAAPKP